MSRLLIAGGLSRAVASSAGSASAAASFSRVGARRTMATGAPVYGPDWTWKPALAAMYGLGGVIIVYGYSASPETRLKFWASDEAKERRDRESVGESAEIGVSYADKKYGFNWIRTEFGVKPEAADSEDEEDDE